MIIKLGVFWDLQTYIISEVLMIWFIPALVVILIYDGNDTNIFIIIVYNI